MSALGIKAKLLVAKSALNDAAITPEVFGTLGIQRTTSTIKWGTGVVSGAVTVEGADDPAYTGTWAPIAVVTFSGTAPKEDYVQADGSFGAIRHRVSTVLSGGTVDSFIQGADC